MAADHDKGLARRRAPRFLEPGLVGAPDERLHQSSPAGITSAATTPPTRIRLQLIPAIRYLRL
jgi:hypothetical protein